MSKLKIGIVGRRGASFYAGINSVEGAELVALCDLNEEWLANEVAEHGIPKRFTSFREMLPEVDAVVVATPMQLHAPQAILALEQGKHVMSEVTACVSMEECWRLLDAVKASGRTYMMAENYCYFEENILVRELVRKGLLGTPYFAEGEYVHEVRFLHHNHDGSPTWRYYWQVGQNGNTYCTHGLGPVMHWLNAFDKDDRIETVSCFGSGRHTDPEHPHDDTTLTLIKLTSGKLIKLRLDMMSNTPGMTFYSIQGTHGVYESGRGGGVDSRIWIGENVSVSWSDERREWKSLDEYQDHLPQSWRESVEAAKGSGHGGGDYHVAREFLRACLTGSTPDVDVYTALEWTAAGLSSQVSIDSGGVPIRVPNFRDPNQRPVWLDLPAPIQ